MSDTETEVEVAEAETWPAIRQVLADAGERSRARVVVEETRGAVDSVAEQVEHTPAGVDYSELGVDPRDFTTTTHYGVFNDPQVFEPRFAAGELPEALRQPLLETPIYEDDDEQRTLRHANLTNDDRRAHGSLERDGLVIVKRQVTLRSPWITDK